MREQEERFRDLVDPPAFRKMREQEERFRDLLDPPALRKMRELDERFRDLVDPPAFRKMRELEERFHDVERASSFARSAELLGQGAGLIESALRLSHLDARADLAAVAAAGISKLARQVTEPSFQPVAELLTAGVAFLASPLEEAPAELAGALPAEVFRALDLDTSPRVDDAEVAKGERDVLASRTSDELELAIRNTDPQLVTLLAGARHAVISDNPDKVRHVCISLRELLGHALRLLAPDASVTSWTQDPASFHNGRPTRKARLEYLYRSIVEKPLRDLVDADIRAALELIDVLSEGSHVLTLGAGSSGILLLLTRAEGTLLMLLRLGTHGNA
jgi:hypothetical protein